MFKKNLMFCLLLASTSVAAEVWNADIRINEVEASTVESNYSCKVEIQNDHDDDAWNTKVVILVSPGVKIEADQIIFNNLYKPKESVTLTKKMKNEAEKNYSESSTCLVSNPNTPSNQQQNSNVSCSLGNLSILANFTVEIKGNILISSNAKKQCTAFVFSESPDANHKNNFKSSY